MLLIAAFALALSQERDPQGFEPATPESVGLDAARLEELGALVQGYVDLEKTVGAELAVIRGDRVVFHRGFGWKHREEDVPMAPGGVFCLRSMTKAVVGTAVQMLIDEKALAPGDPVAKYLPAFDNERSRAITIAHLLTHTSGLPLSSLLDRSLADFDGERSIADLTGENGPEFTPGERFSYSDDGADVLGALIEVVSGKPLAAFLEERIFGPLGMRETAGVMSLDHPLRERVCSNYVGSTGNWTRYWSPEDPPIFAFLLASQGLYGSLLDYARFLRLWRDGGRAGGKRLLSARAVWRALDPENAMGMPAGFAGIEVHYGQMMQLWIDPAAEKKDQLYAFGHGGSDGTMGWVFPELELIVLYFTQTRNGLTSIEIGEAVQRLIVDPLSGAVRAPPVAYTPAELDAFTGLYWEEEDTEYQAILRRGAGLALEIPGIAIVELVPTRTRDRFELKFVPDAALAFERSPEGTVSAFTATEGGGSERSARLVPAADLPSVDEVMARKKAASDWDRIPELGAVRVRTEVDLEKLELHGEGILLARGREFFRADNNFGSVRESLLWRDGRGWSWTSKTALEEVTGARLTALRQDHPFSTIEDWRALYAKLEVLARVEHRLPGAESSAPVRVPALLLRAEPHAGNAYTWIVAEATGLPLALLAIEQVPGMGELGSVTDYADWREVGEGVTLPFLRTASYATPLLGEFVAEWQEIETGIEIEAEMLELQEPEDSKR